MEIQIDNGEPVMFKSESNDNPDNRVSIEMWLPFKHLIESQ